MVVVRTIGTALQTIKRTTVQITNLIGTTIRSLLQQQEIKPKLNLDMRNTISTLDCNTAIICKLLYVQNSHIWWRTLGRMYIVLSDETERKLRLAVVTVFGGKKGDLSSAIEEAVKQWLGKNATKQNITRWVTKQLSTPPKEKRRPIR